MSGLLPVAVYGLEVPPGDIVVPAVPDFPATTFRVTMAAIDPSASPDAEAASDSAAPPRATLKIIRQPPGLDDDDSEGEPDTADYLDVLMNGAHSDEDESVDLIDESSDDEEGEDEKNGGPSDPAKSKKARKEQAVAELRKAMEEESDDEEDVDMDMPNGVNGGLSKVDKGKAKATGDEESDEDDDDEEGLEMEEFVICTLDPTKNYQQPLDITVGEDDRVFFKVSGTHAIYLTGNYVIPTDDSANKEGDMYDSDEEDYDLSPDEDELDDEEESDELDDVDDPRVTELGSDDEPEAPKLVKAGEGKKGKNKRPADASDEEPSNLDEIMAKSLKPAQAGENGEPKLSKKQQKKLKNNAGQAVDATAAKLEEKGAGKGEKKVQFAKNLEQGPAASTKAVKTEDKAEKAEAKPQDSKAGLGAKIVQGVTIDDKKLGKGPAAKKGDRVSMRYIGKLKSNNFQFDSNRKGKPFSFKLGAGEVIKGWDIGVQGMTVGTERRITIPAQMGYGSKGMPGIPANSELVFDVKLLEIK